MLAPVTAPADLLRRLDDIAGALAASGRGVALLGLGSVGRETARLDRWSDLDFFAVVEPGARAAFLDDLGWLAAVAPLAWTVRNTRDGHRVLFEDGILCEMAVFEPADLATIPFAAGRVVWSRPGVDPADLEPAAPPAEPTTDVTWLVGEVLSNLLVGLGRWHRGERLAAARLVQGHAVDRLLELEAATAAVTGVPRDPFAPERRAEARLPGLRDVLPALVPGYERTPEAARAVLAHLARRAEVPAAAHAAVLALLEPQIP